MPWKIRKVNRQWCVVKADDGRHVGCHKTEEGAKRQLAALHASENKSTRK